MNAREHGGADRGRISAGLDAQGCAVLEGLASSDECDELAALYPQDALFRSRVVMARHGFGRGEYKYFGYPLPGPIERLRSALYPPLAEIANRWHTALDIDVRFPGEHRQLIQRCHAAGQRRPTPLLLRYGPGDYNCLRMQSRAEVVPLGKGDAVIFAVRHRPVQGARGVYRVNLRHGVSRVRSGRRHAAGIIFHDAA